MALRDTKHSKYSNFNEGGIPLNNVKPSQRGAMDGFPAAGTRSIGTSDLGSRSPGSHGGRPHVDQANVEQGYQGNQYSNDDTGDPSRGLSFSRDTNASKYDIEYASRGLSFKPSTHGGSNDGSDAGEAAGEAGTHAFAGQDETEGSNHAEEKSGSGRVLPGKTTYAGSEPGQEYNAAGPGIQDGVGTGTGVNYATGEGLDDVREYAKREAQSSTGPDNSRPGGTGAV